ncbi:MAG: hypothetical protein P9F75_11890 [Candidatus Contendobacter sp.]|nr:hypothetical protein [Candidatus Contendobacter sp.]
MFEQALDGGEMLAGPIAQFVVDSGQFQNRIDQQTAQAGFVAPRPIQASLEEKLQGIKGRLLSPGP